MAFGYISSSEWGNFGASETDLHAVMIQIYN